MVQHLPSPPPLPPFLPSFLPSLLPSPASSLSSSKSWLFCVHQRESLQEQIHVRGCIHAVNLWMGDNVGLTVALCCAVGLPQVSGQRARRLGLSLGCVLCAGCSRELLACPAAVLSPARGRVRHAAFERSD